MKMDQRRRRKKKKKTVRKARARARTMTMTMTMTMTRTRTKVVPVLGVEAQWRFLDYCKVACLYSVLQTCFLYALPYCELAS